MNTKLYTITELSKILDLHPKTILRFIHEGKLTAQKIGRTWRVTDDNLKTFCHGELSDSQPAIANINYETLSDRINISTVIEIKEQNSEEASRISNSIFAMLNSEYELDGKRRFDFFFYPEIETAKYVFYGSPQFIGRIINTFEQLCQLRGENHE